MSEEINNNEPHIPTKKEVEECISKIRPYIQQDGGDIALLGIDETMSYMFHSAVLARVVLWQSKISQVELNH